MENSHSFFCNKSCKYFPCHETPDPDNFNCKFCYCPLYHSMECGGNFNILPNGIKDCSHCMIPHRADAQSYVLEHIVMCRKRRRTKWYKFKHFLSRLFSFN